MSAAEADGDPPDLRLVLPAATAWCVVAGGLSLPVLVDIAGAAVLVAGGLLTLHRPRTAAVLVLAGAALAVSALRLTAVSLGPVGDWAAERAVVQAEGMVRSDPVAREGPYGQMVLVELRLERVSARGRTVEVRSPVLVIADTGWLSVQSGQRVRLGGRLGAADGRDLAAVLFARGPPKVVQQPSVVASAVNDLRQGLRDSVSGLPPAERSLVPALVVGDDRDMPEQVAEDFRATGLTHLLAVSGANLTLLLGFLLPVVRLAGVRGRGLAWTGLGAVVFFVLLARPDPSVLRAAAMGAVAMAGLSAGGRRRGTRALCVAVLVLVLVDPWLARSVGFLLSVLATAAIVILAPGWRDALARWMPRWLAEALSIPAAAQLACTPVIVAISGQVSVVAVAANLLAAPAVGPATVLGLVAALVSVVSDQAASVVGWLAGRAAWWIVTVAEQGAALPGAAVPWPTTASAVAIVTLLCLGGALVAPRVLAHRTGCLALVAVTGVVIVQPAAGLGWPPKGWVLAMCDVGQGDAVVLNAGSGAAVVVDTGPDPELVDRCLDRLEVERVPLVVLTHLHADHAGGLPGVFDGRQVAEVEIGPLRTPPQQFRAVRAVAAEHGAAVREAQHGEARSVGPLSWQVLAPADASESAAAPEPDRWHAAESAEENDASIVMRVEATGLSILLTGDIEPAAQQTLLAAAADLDVDVLKVPHHGSPNQDPAFFAAASPAVSLISVGADNDYGHPAADTLDLLRDVGSHVLRTDQDGMVVVVASDSGPAVVTGGGP
ncbi:MAG TPA: DNA internalization-related competence protein ComEC/Rec2 [Nocardioidaceae bacterium]|nr:DNA internalization-related competence protein ComEC/Rec2 [Nocardioidaceae bacterium]